jgi:hypothetical protein
VNKGKREMGRGCCDVRVNREETERKRKKRKRKGRRREAVTCVRGERRERKEEKKRKRKKIGDTWRDLRGVERFPNSLNPQLLLIKLGPPNLLILSFNI